MGYSTIDEFLVSQNFLNQTGTPAPKGGGGGGADIASAGIGLASTIVSARANKPEFSQYVISKCGREPIKFLGIGAKKSNKWRDCKSNALKEYAKLGQQNTGGGGGNQGGGQVPLPDSGQSGAGTQAKGGMNTKTWLIIGGAVVLLGAAAFFITRNRGN